MHLRLLMGVTLLAFSASASAAIVTVPFSGPITQITDPAGTLSPAQLSDQITGYFSYSTLPEDHTGRQYNGTISIDIAGQSVVLETRLNFVDFSYGDGGEVASFSFAFDSNGPTNTAPFYIYALTVRLSDSGATNPVTGTVPPEQLSVADFTSGTWTLKGALLDRSGEFTYGGVIAVPELSSFTLAVAGLLPLMRRRR